MENIVETVEDRIQSAILTAIDNIVGSKIELAIRSINASSGRDVASMSANSERREHTRINASFENVSENNNTIGVTNLNDESRRNSQDGVSELWVPGTQFDRQSHIHHVVTGVKEGYTMLAGGSEQIYNPHHMMTEPSNETHHSTEFLIEDKNRFFDIVETGGEIDIIEKKIDFLKYALSKIWKQNLLKCAISDVFFKTRCLPNAFTPHRQVCSRY